MYCSLSAHISSSFIVKLLVTGYGLYTMQKLSLDICLTYFILTQQPVFSGCLHVFLSCMFTPWVHKIRTYGTLLSDETLTWQMCVQSQSGVTRDALQALQWDVLLSTSNQSPQWMNRASDPLVMVYSQCQLYVAPLSLQWHLKSE